MTTGPSSVKNRLWQAGRNQRLRVKSARRWVCANIIGHSHKLEKLFRQRVEPHLRIRSELSRDGPRVQNHCSSRDAGIEIEPAVPKDHRAQVIEEGTRPVLRHADPEAVFGMSELVGLEREIKPGTMFPSEAAAALVPGDALGRSGVGV